MPIIADPSLPLTAWSSAGVDLIDPVRAARQDPGPLRLLVLHLGAQPLETQSHLLGLLGSTALQLDIVLVQPDAVMTGILRAPPGDGIFHGAVLVADGDRGQIGDRAASDLSEAIGWIRSRNLPALLIGAAANLALPAGILRAGEPVAEIVPHALVQPGHALLRDLDGQLDLPVIRREQMSLQTVSGSGLEPLISATASGVHLAFDPRRRWLFALDHIERGVEATARALRRCGSRSRPRTGPWRTYAQILVSRWLHAVVHPLASFPDP
ncbi:hypothetical protein LBMAG53_23430 [Planctomycetota bacterium]|nr:hypothetical protein LBMAG53_23430 [Planctomycetota bacterium]